RGDRQPLARVDALDAIAQHEIDAQLAVALTRGDREIGGRAPLEVGAQVHAVVGESRLFAHHRDGEAMVRVALAQLLDEAMSNETVADDENAFTRRCFSVAHGPFPARFATDGLLMRP